jgi:hypothetical protein
LRYRVYSGMSVRLFYHLVASRILGCEAHHICMYVNDYELKHLGSITDRFYPDFPEVSTPYLSSECVVRVEFVTNASGENPITDNGMGIETTTITDSMDTANSPQTPASRRVSSRLRSQAQSKDGPEVKQVEPHRRVRDRWYYPHPVPALMGSSDVTDDDEQLRSTGPPVSTNEDGPDALILGPVVMPPIPLNRLQRHNLVKRFHAEGRYRRRVFKAQLDCEWESKIAPAFDQENDLPNEEALMDEEIAFDDFMCQRFHRFDSDFALMKYDFIDDVCCASLPGHIYPNGVSEERPTDTGPDVFMLRRTQELWAGLRRVYFGEVEDLSDSEDSRSDGPSRKKLRTRQSVTDFKEEIAEIRARIRARSLQFLMI